jgi:phytoene dehydrogenase-like protein
MPGKESRGFDAIVIGSGMGALAFASLMARLRGWRVLVLERHFKIGGFTHTFKRPGGFEWDVGVHYVGEMGKGMPSRRLMDLVTDGAVRWNPMPDVYDRFVYPGLEFGVPKGEANFRDALIEAFPQERADIERYFRDVKRASQWLRRRSMAESARPTLRWMMRALDGLTARLPLTTTGRYLEKRFADPRLRAVVASQWGDYGLPPRASAFVTHAIVASHYFNGAWYPDGGAGEIAKAVSAVVRRSGGDLRADHEVTRILVEDGAAVGVEATIDRGATRTRTQFRAPVVVSDAGAWTTFARLLPPSVPLPFRDELRSPPVGLAAVELFLGLRRDPRELGFRGENYWIYTSFDHDDICARQNELFEGRAVMAYLSFPSLKDTRAKRHTAEIAAPLDYGVLERHRAEPWLRRSGEYKSAKERMTRALLDLVERHRPGFRDLVEFAELATPLTFELFTGAPSGAIYGYPATPDRFRKSWLGVETPVRNLFLTGADAGFLGIVGAMMGGVAAAARLLGPFGLLEIMRAAYSRRRARTAPADAPAPGP